MMYLRRSHIMDLSPRNSLARRANLKISRCVCVSLRDIHIDTSLTHTVDIPVCISRTLSLSLFPLTLISILICVDLTQSLENWPLHEVLSEKYKYVKTERRE